MGQHYVPQRYLRGFQSEEKPDHIWTCDKTRQTCKLLPIKAIAQAADFYDEDVEKELNERVEIPGYEAIEKLDRGESLGELDWRHLTYYIATMIRRVPAMRLLGEKLAPDAIANVAHLFKEWLHELFRTGLMDAATLASRLAEADAAQKRFQNQAPPTVIEAIECPWPTLSVLLIIHSMHWRVIRCEGPSWFVTSDNPAYYFEGYGIGSPESELTFPANRSLLLHGSWRRFRGTGRYNARQRLVKEINRRTAHGAQRFIFYQEDADWVIRISRTTAEKLSRINWVGGR